MRGRILDTRVLHVAAILWSFMIGTCKLNFNSGRQNLNVTYMYSTSTETVSYVYSTFTCTCRSM